MWISRGRCARRPEGAPTGLGPADAPDSHLLKVRIRLFHLQTERNACPLLLPLLRCVRGVGDPPQRKRQGNRDDQPGRAALAHPMPFMRPNAQTLSVPAAKLFTHRLGVSVTMPLGVGNWQNTFSGITIDSPAFRYGLQMI